MLDATSYARCQSYRKNKHMKRLHLLPVLALILCVSQAFGQGKETRNVDNFTSINFGIAGKLILRQGSPQKVELSGSADILKEIKTEVSGGRLTIEVKGRNWNWSKGDEITAYITVPNLTALGVSGSGDVIGETTFTTGDFSARVSGSGDAKLTIQASGSIDADISGSGDLNITGKCRSFRSDISGSGDLDLDLAVGDRAVFDVSGSGDVKATGSADEIRTSISGSSRISAEDFQTNKANIKISGSGDISIAVKDEINADISGSGSVRYKGSPGKINSHASGSGKVSKM